MKTSIRTPERTSKIQQGHQLALELFHNIAERLDRTLKTPINTFFLPL